MLKNYFAAGLLLFATSANAQYCTPVPGILGACTNGTQTIRINSVSTTGGILNINNNNNSCSGYTYYSGTNNIIKQNAGGNVNISISLSATTTAYPYTVIVWVDWNRDGVFNNTLYSTSAPNGERMLVSPPAIINPYTASFGVPGNAKNGLTRMRIRAGTRNGTFPSVPPNPTTADPCAAGDFYYGEVEDYDFEVVNPCIPPVTVNFNNLTDKSVSITWAPRQNAVLYEYHLTTVQGFPTASGYHYTGKTTVNLPDASTPIACNTKYYFYVRAICDTGNGGVAEQFWDKSTWVEHTFTTPPCCYTPPATVNYITGTTAIASWSPVQSVIKYEYLVSSDPNMTTPTTSGSFTTNTSLFMNGLSPMTHYKFWLRAWCSPTPTSDWGYVEFLTLHGTNVNNISNDFKVFAYPNPVKDILTIDIPGAIDGKAQITITDITGRIVYTASVTQTKININTSGFTTGVYQLRYTDASHTSVMSVNKQ